MAALAILTGINLLNYLDRYVVSALLSDFKRAPMHLNDFELGTLMSGFLIVYMLAAPSSGGSATWLAPAPDRHRRLPLEPRDRTLRSGTQLCAAARRARHRRHRRGGLCDHRAIAAGGLFRARARAGGRSPYSTWRFPWVRRSATSWAAFMRQYFGWHAAFFVAGMPGVVLALWILRLPDPPRGQKEEGDEAADDVPVTHGPQPGSWSVYLRLLRHTAPTCSPCSATPPTLSPWAAWRSGCRHFLEEVRGIAAVKASAGFGEIVVVTGFVGTFVGGWLGDYWLRYSRQAYL